MSWTIIPVSGPERIIKGKATIAAVSAALNADGLDTVNFHDGRVMLVDDTGVREGKPVNPRATKIYHGLCKPGTTHPICGDVAIVNDEDFA